MLRNISYITIILLAIIFTSCRTPKAQNSKHKKTSKTSNHSKPMINPTTKVPKSDTNSNKLGIYLSGNENTKLISVCNEWMGVPYKYGGCAKDGTDCSCLIQTIYKSVYNKSLYRSASDMHDKNVTIIPVTQVREGDLVFFKIDATKPSHVGIIIKDKYFIHASSSKGVMINSLDEAYYQKYFIDAGRVK